MQAIITTLDTQFTEANKQLMDNMSAMATLKTKVAAYKANGGGRGIGNSGRGGVGRGAGNNAVVASTHYCCTHEPKRGHTSQQCTRHAEGHKKEATNVNQLGGHADK